MNLKLALVLLSEASAIVSKVFHICDLMRGGFQLEREVKGRQSESHDMVKNTLSRSTRAASKAAMTFQRESLKYSA
jgi:hypothetical protein